MNKKDQVLGEVCQGEDVILSDLDDDLTKGLGWEEEGYSVQKFLDQHDWNLFYDGFERLFKTLLSHVGLSFRESFELKNYHQLVEGDYEAHLKVVNQTKRVEATHFPIDFSIVEDRISEILKKRVKSIKPMNQERVFHFRVIRPFAPDYNPIHKDVWQDENRDAINIYVPLVGSNNKSSLLLAPGSHKWSESEITRTRLGANMNEIQFNVPGLLESKRALNLIRPNPGSNEVLIFSPYMLHGLSENQNKDFTRISLEVRFWRTK